jgi:hypothetical protein
VVYDKREAILETRKQTLEEIANWMVEKDANFSVCGPPNVQMCFRGDGYRGPDTYYTKVTDKPVEALLEAMLSSPAASKPQDATATTAARKETE